MRFAICGGLVAAIRKNNDIATLGDVFFFVEMGLRYGQSVHNHPVTIFERILHATADYVIALKHKTVQ